MVQINVETDRVKFEILGSHKFWAFKRRFEIPFTQIAGAHPDPTATAGSWKGWRLPGTQIPGVIIAGTYYLKGERTFWDVHDPKNAIVVELKNHKYQRLVIEVADPAGAVRDLEAIALKSAKKGPA